MSTQHAKPHHSKLVHTRNQSLLRHAKEAGTHTQDRQPHLNAARDTLAVVVFLFVCAPSADLLPQHVWHKRPKPLQVSCLFQQSVTPKHHLTRAAQWLSTQRTRKTLSPVRSQTGSGMSAVHSRHGATATILLLSAAAAAVCVVPGHRAPAQVLVCMSAVPSVSLSLSFSRSIILADTHRSSQSWFLVLLPPPTAPFTTLNTTPTISIRNISCSRPPKNGMGMIGMMRKPPKPKPPP